GRGRRRGTHRARCGAVPRGGLRGLLVGVGRRCRRPHPPHRPRGRRGRLDVPGRWAGGFRAWDEHGVYLATARGVVDGRLLRVPAVALRERANAWFPFGAHLIEGLYRTARS